MALVQRSLVIGKGHGYDDPIKYAINIETLLRQFSNIPYFDESLRYEGPSLNIVGGKSKNYDFESYQKIFPNCTEKDVVTIEEAGHWVHFDKPIETLDAIEQFLQKIDSKL